MPGIGSYLQKHAFTGRLIDAEPAEELSLIVCIPATREPGLIDCLDSLFLCDPPAAPCEVIVLINSGEGDPAQTIRQNRQSHKECLHWIAGHRREGLDFHLVLQEGLPKKHAGAGLARKIVMDEAVRRFDRSGNPNGILASLDADATVETNYFRALQQHYDDHPGTDGCSIRFTHPLEGDAFEDAVYDAIVNYELHQRYYLQGVRYTGYPYAYHTVGSSFSVTASAYCRQGGMSKRQAGEDFYFIQKVAVLGNYTECQATTVHPSPRPSDRVPFGTGPDIARQVKTPGSSYLTYAPGLFRMLRPFYTGASHLYDPHGDQTFLSGLDPLLQDYLEETRFARSLNEIRANAGSPETFLKRFLRSFNMFWILKFLHYAEQRGTEKVEIAKAAITLGDWLGMRVGGKGRKELLGAYRKLESGGK
jgi:hypothetical protein